MLQLITKIDELSKAITTPLVSLLLLFTRIWVAIIFFKSGMVKLSSWDSTLYLFEYEYQVPVLPWQLAAYMGTAAELILPVFMVLGLLTRPMALILFVFNAIAVISYPVLWEGGFYDHQLWGAMILMNVFWGAGAISADFAVSKLGQKPQTATNS
ncbi:DoxX family protein [Thaumasiovibrio subtropicus]|uniref:DoxX family protein n=1 Tax=Thaumasiovibrio subtropicus TaxID=1891207 RepID=UPI000B34F022|nr:DoxX family protein [Thaumasiovibrio subtropicus]